MRLWVLIGLGATAAYLLYRRQADAIASEGFRPGPGNPAAAVKVGPGAMVGASLVTSGGVAMIVPSHVARDLGASVEVIFDISDAELDPTPEVLRGRRGVLPKTSIAWAVFAP